MAVSFEHRRIALFFLVILGTMYLIPWSLPSAAPVTYTPGIQPGDQAVYGQVVANWPNVPGVSIPSIIVRLLNAKSISNLVETVSGTTVTMAQTINGTDQTSTTSTLTGDVASGQGNVTLWTIASGLVKGDHIYNTNAVNTMFGPSSVPTINATINRVVAGVWRKIDVYNATLQPLAGANVHMVFGWDQATGVLVSGSVHFIYSTYGFLFKGSGSVNMTATNLWSATPDFRINVNNLTPTVKTDTLYKVNLTVWSLGGFTGQVTLTSSTNSQLLVPQPSPQTVTLIADGSATSQLAIVPAPVQPEGVYSLNITGTDQSSQSHSLTLNVQVSGDFSLQQLAYPVVSAGLGAVVLAVIIHSYSLSGPVHLTATVSPPGPRVVLTNADPSLTPGLRTWINATISATSSTVPGTYTLTITATKGSLVHSTRSTFTVYPAPPPAAVSKILGLDPPVFYGIIGVAVALAVIVIVQRRKPATQKLIPSSAATS